MSQNKFAFPYPVLSVDGDDFKTPLCRDNVVLGELNTDDSAKYKLPVSLVLQNQELDDLIQNHNAQFVIEVDCPSTHYRRCLKQNNGNFEITFKKTDVAGRVNFQPYIIAEHAFEYHNSDFHEDYGDECFPVEEGDVLAIFNSFKYDFDINYAELKAHSAILRIRESTDPNATEIRYISDEPLIYIELPKEKYGQYQTLGKDYSAIIHASIVQNALLTVLLREDWSEPGEDEVLWKKTIRYRVENEEELKPYRNLSDKENLVGLAYKILHDPVQRMFDCINSISTSSDNNND